MPQVMSLGSMYPEGMLLHPEACLWLARHHSGTQRQKILPNRGIGEDDSSWDEQ